MEFDLNPISLIIICLLIYIGYLSKYYLPNYFKKKAENLAQIQDIEKLTLLVKEVEYKFEERTQNLKAKLDLTNQLQLGLDNEERITLINLHNKINEYYNFLTDLSFNGIDFNDNNSIRNHMNERNLKNDSLFVLKNNTMLFIDDENGIVIEEAFLDVIEIFTEFSGEYIDYCHKLSKLNLINKEKLSKEELDDFYSQISELNSNYSKQILEMIKIVAPKMSEITRTIKTYLNEKIKKPNA